MLAMGCKQGNVSQGVEGGFCGSGNFAEWMCWAQLWFYLKTPILEV